MINGEELRQVLDKMSGDIPIELRIYREDGSYEKAVVDGMVAVSYPSEKYACLVVAGTRNMPRDDLYEGVLYTNSVAKRLANEGIYVVDVIN